MPRACWLSVVIAAALGGLVAAGPLYPCRFFMPFTQWNAGNASCPPTTHPLACATDADCADPTLYCTYGGPYAQLACGAATPGGARACGMVKESWPTLDRAGGLCDNATETCAVCTSGECTGTPLCVQARFCDGTATASEAVECHFTGHSYP